MYNCTLTILYTARVTHSRAAMTMLLSSVSVSCGMGCHFPLSDELKTTSFVTLASFLGWVLATRLLNVDNHIVSGERNHS